MNTKLSLALYALYYTGLLFLINFAFEYQGSHVTPTFDGTPIIPVFQFLCELAVAAGTTLTIGYLMWRDLESSRLNIASKITVFAVLFICMPLISVVSAKASSIHGMDSQSLCSR